MATTGKSKAGDKPVKEKAAAPKAAAKTTTKSAPKTASKPAAAKKVATPAATKTKAAKPATAVKKPAKAAAPASVANAEQRRCYIEVAAYYIAERRGFQGGNPADDWMKAEAEIERLLREGVLKP